MVIPKVISIYSRTPSCGKKTIALNVFLAYASSKPGHRILIVDFSTTEKLRYTLQGYGKSMRFRFYTNTVSQASRAFAAGTFITGLLLLGFGTIIVALPKIFAYLFGGVFFIAGLGCMLTAVKIFIAQRKLNKMTSEENPAEYRENVRIRSGDQ